MHMPKSLTSLLGIILIVYVGGMPAFADEPVVPFRWENWEKTDRQFLEEQRKTLERKGAFVGEVEETKTGEKSLTAIALILVGTAAVSVLAETIVNAVKTWNQCGIIVDLRGMETVTRKNCDLDPGEIMYVTGNGKVEKISATEKPSIAIETLKVVMNGFLNKLAL